jgi:FtsP/CotA-like multicopper oxidase with cupredoxin domain
MNSPIQTLSSFVYRFIADTPGTHWFHGHLMNDRADGILGGFVVMDKEEKITDLDGQKVQIGREYYSILQVKSYGHFI